MSHDIKHTTGTPAGWAARHRKLLAILVGAVAVAVAVTWILLLA